MECDIKGVVMEGLFQRFVCCVSLVLAKLALRKYFSMAVFQETKRKSIVLPIYWGQYKRTP